MANSTFQGITISTTDSLATGQAIMIGMAQQAFEPAAPDPSLVTNVDMPPGHRQYDMLTYARLQQAQALTEGQDLTTTQQLFANPISIDPTEHGIIVTLSTRLIRRQPDNLTSQAGVKMGVAMRERQTRDIHALYGGLSKDAGSQGTTLDITYLRGSNAYLRTDNDSEYGPAPMPYVYAAHPENISDIVADLTDAGSRVGGVEMGLSTELIQGWWRGSDRAYGIQVFDSGYLTRDAGDDVTGATFSMDAFYLVNEGPSEPTTDDDPSARLIEYGLFKSWGEAEHADPHGVAMTFDAAATI